MKKTISILIVYLMCVNCGIAQTPKTDWKELNLNDKVKSLRENQYELVEKFGALTKGERIDANDRTFNNSGNIVEGNKFREDGNLEWKYIIKYDSVTGKRIEKNWYHTDGSIDKRGNVKYNKDGNLIEERIDDAIRSEKEKEREIGEVLFYKYDDNGNKIEENQYSSDGSTGGKYSYKYSKEGKMIEKNFSIDGKTSFEKTTYIYDSGGKKIEEDVYNYLGYFINKHTFSYDDKGNITEYKDIQTPANYGGTVKEKLTYSYKYDKRMNWIERVESKSDIVMSVTEREITYF